MEQLTLQYLEALLHIHTCGQTLKQLKILEALLPVYTP